MPGVSATVVPTLPPVNAVPLIVNPPISPSSAFILPLISKPAADADRAVVFASVLSSNVVPVSFRCLPTGEPIVVVAPNEAVVCPLRTISKLFYLPGQGIPKIVF